MFFRRYDRRARYFDLVINWLVAAGLTDYFYKRRMPYKDIREQVEVAEEKLVLEHFFLPMVFGATGLLLGAVALAVEFLSFSRE